MSRVLANQAPLSRAALRWKRWRFYLSAFLLILPLFFLPRYFDDLALSRGDMGLGQRELGELAVGPWSVRLAEWRVEPPRRDGAAGHMKTFTLAQCKDCIGQIKAAYLRVGKPRNLRTAGALFSGSPYRQMASVLIPDQAAPDADLWLTLEGWDGAMHQARLSLSDASPTTVQWLTQRKGRQ
ncbi:MAG: thiamine pyrophosphate-binding protein [Pusillimonas sp.]